MNNNNTTIIDIFQEESLIQQQNDNKEMITMDYSPLLELGKQGIKPPKTVTVNLPEYDHLQPEEYIKQANGLWVNVTQNFILKTEDHYAFVNWCEQTPDQNIKKYKKEICICTLWARDIPWAANRNPKQIWL